MESSPKPKRPNFGPYIPVHRRKQQEQPSLPKPVKARPIPSDDSDVKRRGRGQFRAPSTDDTSPTKINESSVDKLESNKNSPTIQKEDCLQDVTTRLGELQTREENKAIEEKDDWEEEWEEPEVTKKSPVSKDKVKERNQNPATFPDESTTILDCSDFPSSFKTHHLQDMFKEYESMRGGYSIKWMDDTRALIIFQHPYTAKMAFMRHVNNPLVKIKPFKGQIEQKSTSPVPKRPPTTDMVARRLVHGALGVRSVKTAEQLKAEKDLIRAAREKRQAEKANSALRAQQIADAFNE